MPGTGYGAEVDLRSTDIPQTTLARVGRLVVDCGKGATTKEQMVRAWTRTGADPGAHASDKRQVDYALYGAQLLGLIETGEDDVSVLTERGRRLASAGPDSEEGRRIFREAMSASARLREIAPGLADAESFDEESFRARIARVPGLSARTAGQRAGMMLKWREEARTPQLRFSSAQLGEGMWRRIQIKNFRSLEQAKVVLPPFCSVVGPNGSGKSNFTDALVFARDIALDAQSAVAARGEMQSVRRFSPGKPLGVTIDVRAAQTREKLDTDYARHYFEIRSREGGDWSFANELVEVVERGSPTNWVRRKGGKVTGSVQLSDPGPKTSLMLTARQLPPFKPVAALHRLHRIRLNADAMRQPHISSAEKRLREDGKNIGDAIRSLNPNDRRLVTEAMQRIVPGLRNVAAEPAAGYLALKFEQAQGPSEVAHFNGLQMSDGTLRALGIVTASAQMEAGELLLIEEPEVAIHPGAAGLLFDVLKDASRRGAVLMTTHSADLLDAARDEEILVCEMVDGVTRIGTLAETQRDLVREGLFALSEVMRSEPLRIQDSPRQAAEMR